MSTVHFPQEIDLEGYIFDSIRDTITTHFKKLFESSPLTLYAFDSRAPIVKEANKKLKEMAFLPLAEKAIRMPEGISGSMVDSLAVVKGILDDLSFMDKRFLKDLKVMIADIAGDPESLTVIQDLSYITDLDRLIPEIQKKLVKLTGDRKSTDFNIVKFEDVYLRKKDIYDSADMLEDITKQSSKFMAIDWAGEVDRIVEIAAGIEKPTIANDIVEKNTKAISNMFYIVGELLRLLSITGSVYRMLLAAYEEHLEFIAKQ